MAHPSREKYFGYLKEQLGDVPFSIDTKSIGVWPNCKRAWQMHDPSADYHVVIQDDAILCENFIEKAIEVLEKNKDRGTAFSFFYGTRQDWVEEGKKGMQDGFVIRKNLKWGVAVCLPVSKINYMIAHADTMTIKQDDTRIGRFLQFIDMRVYYPMPSLVEHRGDEESLVGDVKGRRAFKFIDDK